MRIPRCLPEQRREDVNNLAIDPEKTLIIIIKILIGDIHTFWYLKLLGCN